MSIEINGIAHIQLTIENASAGLPFWERLCHFMGMKTLIRGDDVVYCIGGRTGVLVREALAEKKGSRFDQERAGLHHVCFRARSREDVDHVAAFVRDEPHARLVHDAEDGKQFAPGYYSVLFEDPDGIRVEVNFVPGKGHFGERGRLGPDGPGPRGAFRRDGNVEPGDD